MDPLLLLISHELRDMTFRESSFRGADQIPVRTTSSNQKCWFPLSEIRNIQKVEEYRREYEGPLVGVDPGNLMSMLRQKINDKSKVFTRNG